MKYVVKQFLFILSFPIFSRIYGRITKIKKPVFIAKAMIRLFVDTYKIDMNNFEGEIDDYKSLASIFIRKLNPKIRKLSKSDKFILSPADGVISSVLHTKTEKVIQVKGLEYSLNEFFNKDIDWKTGWFIATIYLSPKDYHRYHFPIEGTVTGYCHMKGHLYPVNDLGLKNIKKLFIKNERIALELDNGKSSVFIAAVGATFVGSIKMEFIKKYKRDNKWKNSSFEASQMDEMGRFELGSTIIMAIPENFASPVDGIIGNHFKAGDKIFKLK